MFLKHGDGKLTPVLFAIYNRGISNPYFDVFKPSEHENIPDKVQFDRHSEVFHVAKLVIERDFRSLSGVTIFTHKLTEELGALQYAKSRGL